MTKTSLHEHIEESFSRPVSSIHCKHSFGSQFLPSAPPLATQSSQTHRFSFLFPGTALHRTALHCTVLPGLYPRDQLQFRGKSRVLHDPDCRLLSERLLDNPRQTVRSGATQSLGHLFPLLCCQAELNRYLITKSSSFAPNLPRFNLARNLTLLIPRNFHDPTVPSSTIIPKEHVPSCEVRSLPLGSYAEGDDQPLRPRPSACLRPRLRRALVRGIDYS